MITFSKLKSYLAESAPHRSLTYSIEEFNRKLNHLIESTQRKVPFTKKNFPRAGNGIVHHGTPLAFRGVGERTNYTPTSMTGDFAYSSGFPVIGASKIFSGDGKFRTLATLRENDVVHFTYPPELYTRNELDPTVKLNAPGIFAAVSLTSFKDRPIGFISISSVAKPSKNPQNRVIAGSSSQDIVAAKTAEIAASLNRTYELVSIAAKGSTVPDVVVLVDGIRTQFEVKGQKNKADEITVFDKSGMRGLDDAFEVRAVVKMLRNELGFKNSNGDDSLTSYVDELRLIDSTIGYPNDEHVVKSGKLPSVYFTLKNNSNLQAARKMILNHFAESKDSYFAIHNRGTNQISIYFTGYGKNILNMPVLPSLRTFRISTYGGASSGSMRIGFKIRL